MSKMIHWNELLLHLQRKVHFRKVKGDTTWNCDGELTFTKEFCKKKGLDFNGVALVLANFGGFCDCEVLFNAAEFLKNRPITDKFPLEEVEV